MTTSPPPPSPPSPSKKAMDFAAVRDWPGYFRAVAGKPARDTLIRALNLFEAEDAIASKLHWRVAVDIGCGEGRDTREILRRAGPTRWKLMPCDSSPDALRMLFDSLSESDRKRIGLPLCTMENLPILYANGARHGPTKRVARSVDLVNASFALPFCNPQAFPRLWSWIVGLIHPGGRFAGQLFGDRDSWAALPDRTHHARQELDRLFDGFVWEELREEEKDDKDALGNPKHWQVFHIVARKL